MSHKPVSAPFFSPLRKVRWRLTFSYFLVAVAAIFILGWWGLIAVTIYLHNLYPTLSMFQVFQESVLPALRIILPGVLILFIPAAAVGAYFGFLNARWLDLRLTDMRSAVKAWRAGDFSASIQDQVHDEIGSFGRELNGMAAELERLLQAREELSAVEERNQLARDLHDSVKQQVTAAAFQVSAAKSMLAQGRLDEAMARVAEIEGLVIQTHKELNAIIFELRPVALPGSLSDSLREYLQDWSRQNAIALKSEIQEVSDIPVDTQAELIRFTQEALSNVARHSQASQVEVSLARIGTSLMLTIHDNGQGFDAQTLEQPGFGLKTMRERITRCGGEFSIKSQQPGGTRIAASVPLRTSREIYE
jgi:NarL family two-component system sensor histidine kinase LiaS